MKPSTFTTRALAASALMAASFSSQAATLDFIGYTDNVVGEQAVEQVTSINAMYHATYMQIATSAYGFNGNEGDALVHLVEDPFAYLDGNHAGLGVCQTTTNSRQCNPAGDDNLQQGEVVGLTWDIDVNIEKLFFRGESHPKEPSNIFDGDSFAYSLNSGLTWLTANLLLAPVDGGVGINGTVKKGDYLLLTTTGTHEQFYLSAAEVSAVPLPAGAWLFGSALVGAGVVARRKKKA